MDIQLPQRISRVLFRCSEKTQTALIPQLVVGEGSVLTEKLLRQTRETAEAFDVRLAVLVKQSLRREAYLQSTPDMRRVFLASAIDDGISVVIWDRSIPPERIRRDGNEQSHQLVEKAMPTYGEDAPARAVVHLAIVIGKDGGILEVDPSAGPASLIAPTVNAVGRWKYRPTLLNGRPVEVETTVEVSFSPEQ